MAQNLFTKFGLTPVDASDSQNQPQAQPQAAGAPSVSQNSSSPITSNPFTQLGLAKVSGSSAAASAPSAAPQNLQQNLQTQGNQGYFKGLAARVGAEQVGGAQKVASSISEGANLMEQGQQKYNAAAPGIQGTGQRLASDAKTVEGMGTAAFGTIAGAAQSIFAPITAAVSPIIKAEAPLFPKALALEYPQLAQLYKALSPTIQAKVLPQIQTLAQKHPDATTLVGDLINTGLLAVGGGQAEAPVKEAVQEGLEGGIKGATDSLKQTVSDIPAAASDLKTSVAKKATEYYTNAEKDDWSRIVDTKPNSKSAEIFNAAKSKGTNIADVLVNSGIKLSDNSEGGLFTTDDSATKLRGDAGKITSDLLRPALQEADPSVARITKEDIISDAKKAIDKTNLTPERKDVIKELFNGAKLKDDYSLSELLDERINRDQNSKYNAIGETSQQNEALKNKALADAMRGLLEDNAPEGVPVKAVNKEASKLYQTAEYLESVNGKKIPRTLGSRITSTLAKGAGAAAGAALGGGILLDVAGYHFGGILEDALENMTNPVRNLVLDSLQKENPEAFSQVSKYMTDQQSARSTRLALPPPTELGTPQNPRIANAPLGASATFEPQAQNINTEPAAQPPQPLALPPGKPGSIAGPTISLPPAGTYDKEALEKSGLNEVLNAKMKNPADRRRFIQLFFPPK